MTELSAPKKRGRPAAFDYDTALQQAMYAFWQHGYEGTSMSALMDVMQMNKASIYAAYGSKEALFQKAVERYVQGPAAFLATALSQPTAQQVIECILLQAAHMLTETHHPAGCLVTQGALACGMEAEAMKTLLNGYRNTLEQKLSERFESAVQTGEIAASEDVKLLAKLVMTVHQGMTVQAVHGASQQALASVARTMSKLLTQDFMHARPGQHKA